MNEQAQTDTTTRETLARIEEHVRCRLTGLLRDFQINVGTRASIPDVPGLVIAGPMTHVEALDLERIPGHLVILGGGCVGLEFAQAMRRFGSRVTIVQHGPRLLTKEDPDVTDALLE